MEVSSFCSLHNPEISGCLPETDHFQKIRGQNGNKIRRISRDFCHPSHFLYLEIRTYGSLTCEVADTSFFRPPHGHVLISGCFPLIQLHLPQSYTSLLPPLLKNFLKRVSSLVSNLITITYSETHSSSSHQQQSTQQHGTFNHRHLATGRQSQPLFWSSGRARR